MDPSIIVNGKEYPITSFNLGEEAEIERITGQGYDLDNLGPLGLLAVAYVVIKRVDPTVQLEDLKLLGYDDIQVKAASEAPVPPLLVEDSSASSESSTPSGENDSDEEAPTLAPTGTSP